MLKPALIIDACVNQNPGSEDVFFESALLVLDKTGTDDDSEFNIRFATLDNTIYFLLDQDDLWGILNFLEQQGIKCDKG